MQTDSAQIMPVTRRSTRSASKKRVRLSENEEEEGAPSGPENQVNGSPSKAAVQTSSKGRQRPPLRDQNAEVRSGKEEEGELRTGVKGEDRQVPVRSTTVQNGK